MRKLKTEWEALEEKIRELKSEYRELEGELIQFMQQPSVQSAVVSGKIATGYLRSMPKPKLRDFDKFYAHVVKRADKALLHRRVNETRWREHLDSGLLVPGTESYDLIRIGLTARRKK